MVSNFGLSHRRACNALGLNRSTQQYRAKYKDDSNLRKRIREIAEKKRRYGSPRIQTLLRREGILVNHKKTERIYREEGLHIRKRKRKKITAVIRIDTPKAEYINHKWSMDFVSDSFCTGRKFRSLAIVDDFSRECPVIEVDTSLGGKRVVRVLDRLAETRGLPKIITMDNGPEFAGEALDEWAYRNGVELNFIRPGKPVENAYAESFNGKFRDECLNEHWFLDMSHAREIIEAWRVEYNTERPHRSLNQLTPAEFARLQKEKKSLQILNA